jgi:hypothetical protein
MLAVLMEVNPMGIQKDYRQQTTGMIWVMFLAPHDLVISTINHPHTQESMSPKDLRRLFFML